MACTSAAPCPVSARIDIIVRGAVYFAFACSDVIDGKLSLDWNINSINTSYLIEQYQLYVTMQKAMLSRKILFLSAVQAGVIGVSL